MAEQPIQAPATGAGVTQIDLSNYVPKEEFQKVEQRAKDNRKDLEKLKEQLLDKDYLDYLDNRKRVTTQANNSITPSVPNDMRVRDMRNSDLVKLVQESTLAIMNNTLTPIMQQINTRITNMEAGQEAADVANKYEDFAEFREDVVALLERSPNDVTIEQAYLMAKASREPRAEEEEERQPPRRNERPGTIVPLNGDTVQVFKNSEEAAMAAASEVLARHGIQGDSI